MISCGRREVRIGLCRYCIELGSKVAFMLCMGMIGIVDRSSSNRTRDEKNIFAQYKKTGHILKSYSNASSLQRLVRHARHDIQTNSLVSYIAMQQLKSIHQPIRRIIYTRQHSRHFESTAPSSSTSYNSSSPSPSPYP
jgi:hypothetical protein